MKKITQNANGIAGMTMHAQQLEKAKTISAKAILFLTFFLFTIHKISAQDDTSLYVSGNLFVRNDGQLIDENRELTPDVLFYTNFQNCRHYFQQNKVEHVFYDVDNDNEEKVVKNMYRFDMEFLDCNNEGIEVRGEEAQSDFFNFYFDYCPNGITGVPIFKTVHYGNVWNEINIDFSKGCGLDFTATINPGADINQLRFRFNGVESAELNDEGLMLNSPFGRLTYAKPTAWQEIDGNRIPVSCDFYLEGNNLSFSIGDYDISQPLYLRTITPTIIIPVASVTDQWTTYYGDAGADVTNDVFVSSANNAYTVGTTSSLYNMTAGVGIVYALFQGVNDAIIVKFNNLRVREWATYYGGPSSDYGQFIQVTANGVYFAGLSLIGLPLCTTCNGYHTNTLHSWDVFLVKLQENNGGLNPTTGISTYLGGSAQTEIHAMTSDQAGNVYLGGVVFFNPFANSLPYVSLSGAYNKNSIWGSNDGYIAKFNAANNLVWCTAFGGANDGSGCPGNCEEVNGMACDNLNNLYLTGTTASLGAYCSPPCSTPPLGFPLVDPLPGNDFVRDYSGGYGDAFVTKFDNLGRILWSTEFGGQGTENFFNLAHNNHGIAVNNTTYDIYITGSTQSTTGNFTYPNFPIVPYTNIAGVYNQQNNASPGSFDIYVARFTAQFQLFYSTFYGGGGNDYGIGVSIEQGTTNAAYFTGTTYSGNFPTKPYSGIGSFYQSTLKGGSDAFLIKMQGNLDRTYSTYFGGTSADYGYSIGTGPFNGYSQNVIICGEAQSNTQFPLHNPGNGAYYDGINNGDDGFVGNFRNNGTLRIGQGTNNDIASVEYNPNMYLIPEQSGRRIEHNTDFFATVYPQPANEQITINTTLSGFFDVEIFDSQGKRIDKFSTNTESESINYDVRKLPVGLYLLKITSANRKAVSKFLISR